jgi:hypothetical protein
MFQLRQHGGGSGPLCMNPPNVSPDTIATYRPWTQGTRAKIISIVASVVLIVGVCVIFGLKGKGEGLEAVALCV